MAVTGVEAVGLVVRLQHVTIARIYRRRGGHQMTVGKA